MDDIESIYELPENDFRDFKEKLIFTVTEIYRENQEELRQKVCVEFEYCKKRNSMEATALEAGVIALDIAHTGGIAYLIFFGFRRGFFDELCGCDQ